MITEKLKYGIACYKYNYTLDQDTEDPGNNYSIFNITRDEKNFVIMRKIPLD